MSRTSPARPNYVAALALLGALAGSGCAQNSIFELTLDMPPAAAPRTQLVVEARSGEADFSSSWQQTQIPGIELETTNRNLILVSFEGSGEQLTQELRVKVRYCIDPRCTDLLDGNAPEVRYVFERVFYQGRYTYNTQVISTLPAVGDPGVPNTVGRCAIRGEGCREGDSDNNCMLSDGKHFCETD